MSTSKHQYDPTSAASIFAFSRGLLHRTLEEAVKVLDPNITKEQLVMHGKGGMGQLVEKYFFGYEPNSKPTPDFEEAGLELKTTPLKKLSNSDLAIKERLVCDMIDYCGVVDVPFEESPFYKKSLLMLIIFYLHISGKDLRDLEFLYSVLWQLKDKDLMIIRQDYEFIIDKIKQGKAHELSEGDTMYLGACRKGQKGDSLRKQPFNDIGAPKRAFSLKTSYMREILRFVQSKGKDLVTNTDVDIDSVQLVSEDELAKNDFEKIIIDRFKKFVGMDYRQIGKAFGKDISPKEKSRNASAAKLIMMKGLKKFEDADEIRKAGIIPKTIRINANGSIDESMSFENIDYQEVYDCDEWTESRFYEIVTSKFMFIIFRETDSLPEGWCNKEKRYIFDRLVFWTMPQQDIEIAEKYWTNIKNNVSNDTLDKDNTYWRLQDHKCFHVRPKARKSSEKYLSPISGKEVPKKAYWFNDEYVKGIVKSLYGAEWTKIFK